MSQKNFHKNIAVNPFKLLPVLEKTKTAYNEWIIIHRNMPRTERFGIGSKIDFLFLESLEIIRKAAFSEINQKIGLLEVVLDKIDSLRFFIQIAWEAHLIPNNQFISLGGNIENIGKMLGGWRKGLIIKTSAIKTEER